MSGTLSETAEGSVESKLALQGRGLRGGRRAISELESLNPFEKGFEDIVIHVGVVPLRHHLSREFLAELHWGIVLERNVRELCGVKGRNAEGNWEDDEDDKRGRGEMERHIYIVVGD